MCSSVWFTALCLPITKAGTEEQAENNGYCKHHDDYNEQLVLAAQNSAAQHILSSCEHRLVSSVIVVAAISIPYLKEQLPLYKRKLAQRNGRRAA